MIKLDNKLIKVKRDCDAILIPGGEKVVLVEGTNVTITQALGGDFTVHVNGNLLKISGSDADAIGMSSIDKSIKNDKNTDHVINEQDAWNSMKTCYDPEIPINVVDLGLIYDLRLKEHKNKTKICREIHQFLRGLNQASYKQKDGCVELEVSTEKFRWTDSNSFGVGFEKWERELNRENLHYFEYYRKLTQSKYSSASDLENYQCRVSNLEEFELIKTKLKDLEEPFLKIADEEKEKIRLMDEEKASKNKI